MNIAEIEILKKKYEDRKSRIAKIEAARAIRANDVNKRLNEYGITNIKDFPKLLKKKEQDALEVSKLAEDISSYLETSESELEELERDMNS